VHRNDFVDVARNKKSLLLKMKTGKENHPESFALAIQPNTEKTMPY
jgi:hypothetical protein